MSVFLELMYQTYSGSLIFDHFVEHLWLYISNNASHVNFEVVQFRSDSLFYLTLAPHQELVQLCALYGFFVNRYY